jgi:hypothetical protein
MGKSEAANHTRNGVADKVLRWKILQIIHLVQFWLDLIRQYCYALFCLAFD